MRKFIVPKLAIFCALATPMPAWAGMIHRAGEWQITMNNGRPLLACYARDETVDQTYEKHALADIKGANCRLSSMVITGNEARYSARCTIGDVPMTQTGTITQTGPNTFLEKVRGSGGGVSVLAGKNMTLPDMEMSSVEQRLGPCKPGDQQIDN